MKEKIRVLAMIDAYKKRQVELPHGSLTIREINNNKYCYLSYREGKKVVSQYVGPEEKIEELQQLIQERKHINAIMKMLNAEYNRILKMERVR